MVADGSGKEKKGAESTNLQPEERSIVKVCGSAADRVAEARRALNADSLDPSEALKFLDEAISCLKDLPQRGKAPADTAESAVLAFPADRTRHSA